MNFFRYPGGKSKMIGLILPLIGGLAVKHGIVEYREPFFGGGAIGLNVMKEMPYIRKMWINDRDAALSALWTSIIRYPDELIAKVEAFIPSPQHFYDFKAQLQEHQDCQHGDDKAMVLYYGFRKLAIHQMSFSGLGTMSGGPLGGRQQKSAGGIASRWSPANIAKKVRQAHQFFARVDVEENRCTSVDFEQVITKNRTRSIIYLDPPYFVKGGELYQHAFGEQDHIRLASTLKEVDHLWVLSYDDCPEVRDLYARWAELRTIDVNYTINGSTTKPEVLITPKGAWGMVDPVANG